MVRGKLGTGRCATCTPEGLSSGSAALAAADVLTNCRAARNPPFPDIIPAREALRTPPQMFSHCS